MTEPVQPFTLHTHTRGFDGRSSIAEMVNAARDHGIGQIGFSNHFIVHPEIKNAPLYPYSVRGGYSAIYSSSFDEAIEKFRRHYDELDAYQAHSDVHLLRGMEVDYFDSPAWRDGFARAVEILKPDYCIGAVHFIEQDGKPHNMHDIRNAELKYRLLVDYWTKVGRAASSGLFNWMAHLDLPKKVGLARGADWAAIEGAVVRAIARSGTAVEINTGLYRSTCYEPYPSPRILRAMADKNVPVLLSDDAHDASQIGRHFEEAKRLATECGIRKFADIRSLTRH